MKLTKYLMIGQNSGLELTNMSVMLSLKSDSVSKGLKVIKVSFYSSLTAIVYSSHSTV